MDKKTIIIAAGLLAAILAQAQATSAHMEPKKNDNTEKCYGVVKAHKNDCASKTNKHSCGTQAKKDSDPNEWIATPKGLCEKLAGGKLEESK